MRGVSTSFCLVAASLAACTQEGTGTSGSGLTGDPTRPDCGFTVAEPPPPLAPDPCAAGRIVFGPERFERARGTPDDAVRDFTVPAAGAVCVRVSNAGVSSAEIRLDGAPLISPSRFNPHVTEITERAGVAAGDHVLSVSVRSSPGSALEVDVRFAAGETAAYGRREGRFLAVQNLRDDPDPFSPADMNGVRDTTTFSIEVDVRRLPGGPVMTYRLRTTFEIADPVACADTRRLVVEIPLLPGTVPRRELPSSAWDGRDAVGSLVPDGGYFYRAVVEMIRVTSRGHESVLDRVESEIQRVTVDNTGPFVELITPRPIGGGGYLKIRLEPRQMSDVEFAGVTGDSAGVRAAEMSVNGVPLSLPPGGEFSLVAELQIHGEGPWVSNVVVFRVDDEAGNETVMRVPVYVAVFGMPHQIAVRFLPEAPEARVRQILDELGATVRWAELPIRYYVLGLPPGSAANEVVDDLRGRPEVAYATLDGAVLGDQAPNDPRYDRWCRRLDVHNIRYEAGCTWALHNGDPPPGPFNARTTWGCGDDGVCRVAGQTCEDRRECGGPCCRCTEDAHCPAGRFCIADDPAVGPAGYCGIPAIAGADIGWGDAVDAVRAAVSASDDVVFAIQDYEGVLALAHPDLRARVWTNTYECCGAGTCPDDDRDGLPDCTPDSVFPEPGAPEAQRPGIAGFDDDGDGLADFEDPEVANLVFLLCSNRIDDDGDGRTDDGTGDVVGCEDEQFLAARDDDENGYVDDVHGVNFWAAKTQGPLAGTTIPERVDVDLWGDHGTGVAGAAAATMDNADYALGVHPAGRIMALFAQERSQWPSLARYASANHADILVWSGGLYTDRAREDLFGPNDLTDPADPGDLRWAADIEDATAAWVDGLDPNMLYVFSAGNTRYDLDAAGLLPELGGLGMWRFPQNIDSPYSLTVAATNVADEFADYWVHCDARLCATQPGSSYGARTVEVGAPGDVIDVPWVMWRLLPDGTSELLYTDWVLSGTSFSAPIAAGVAGLGVSAFPERLREQPLRIIERTLQTGVTLPSLAGRTVAGKRVSVSGMLDEHAYPLPAAEPFENRSRRLNDMMAKATHDVDFLDRDGDGDIDYLLEVYGGASGVDQALEPDQPRLFEYEPGSHSFRNVTERLPAIAGNYNKADEGDLNGDECSDIVLAGFVQDDPDGTLMGVPNVFLLQNQWPLGGCSGSFRDATDEAPAGVRRFPPTRNDVTRDVDLFDADGDTDLDIYFTNASCGYWAGCDFGDQLLVNNGLGFFSDASSLLERPPPGSGDAHKSGAAACDIDGNGNFEIIQAVDGDRNRLFVRQADGTWQDEAADRGFPSGSGFSHDVECGNLTGDPLPEVLFARREGRAPLYLVNDGTGHFADQSWRFTTLVIDPPRSTQEIELCQLDGVGPPEVLLGNGDIWHWWREANQIFVYDVVEGRFDEASAELGFDFRFLEDLTEDIECADMDGLGGIDTVVVGNTGQRNWLYARVEP